MTILKNKPVLFNNLFDELFANLPTQSECNHVSTAINIHETNDAYHVELNAPGRKKEDFKINADKGLLTITYETKQEAETTTYKTLRREFSATNFKRSFNLADNINIDAINAKYIDGVLNVYLPKKEEVKLQTKEINIL